MKQEKLREKSDGQPVGETMQERARTQRAITESENLRVYGHDDESAGAHAHGYEHDGGGAEVHEHSRVHDREGAGAYEHSHAHDSEGAGADAHGYEHGDESAAAYMRDHVHDIGSAAAHEHEHHHESVTAHGHAHGHGGAHGAGHRHVHSQEEKKAVVNRLSKAIGHLEAVRRMVENDADCSEVLIQLAAVRSALNNTGKVILKNHISHCIVEAVEENDQEAIEMLNQAIDKFIK